jgi:hypothetical protein
MYVGLLYGSGMLRLDDARCAFENAVKWDPGLQFDDALATPAVKATFTAARAHVCGT